MAVRSVVARATSEGRWASAGWTNKDHCQILNLSNNNAAIYSERKHLVKYLQSIDKLTEMSITPVNLSSKIVDRWWRKSNLT